MVLMKSDLETLPSPEGESWFQIDAAPCALKAEGGFIVLKALVNWDCVIKPEFDVSIASKRLLIFRCGAIFALALDVAQACPVPETVEICISINPVTLMSRKRCACRVNFKLCNCDSRELDKVPKANVRIMDRA